MVRGKEREDAILAAALELIGETGYEAMTIDGIAARASASKATIYRRWRNKAELVRAALDAHDAQHNAAIPDTGALRSDLIAVMEALRDLSSGPYLTMIAAVAGACRHDKELAAAIQPHLDNDDLSPFLEALRRAVDRGELSADADDKLVHDVAEAMIQRQLQVGAPFDETFIHRVVDDILLVLLGAEK